MYPPMGHPSQQTGYVILYNVLFVIILQETLFLYLPFLGWVRTISPISALEFIELGSFTRDN